MAKLQKKSQTQALNILFPDSAGIDVGATLMQVCIPPEKCEDNNRAFGTTTDELIKLTEWLLENDIKYVAMEATGVYWMPLFNMLMSHGVQTMLLNAADVKNYTARKTDINDAEWLMTLMRHGMVKPSFQVDDLSRKLRNLTRHRESLGSQCSDCIRRMQKCLEMMNIKLTEVISDITGASGCRIIEAIIGGTRDAAQLAMLAIQCKRSQEDIAAALKGTWNEELILMLSQYYVQYNLLRKQQTDLDPHLEAIMTKMAEIVISQNEGVLNEFIPSNKKPKRKSNQLNYDLEKLSSMIWGVNLMRIDGVQAITVLSLMGELGYNFTEHFKNAAHFCSWCALCPNDKITGGRIVSSHMKKYQNRVANILRNCAQTLAKSKGPFGDYYRRMRSKGGGKFAVCATAHKLATVIFTMVSKKVEYNSEKVSVRDEVWLKKKIHYQEKQLQKLKNQIFELSNNQKVG